MLNVHKVKALPEHQLPVETSSLIKLRKILKMLLDTKKDTGYSMMGAIIGDAGLGKTVSVYSFVDSLNAKSYTGQPEAIIFRVPEHPTPRSVAWNLLVELGERPSGTSYEIKQRVIKILKDSMIKLVIADEGDFLTSDTFETLRYIHDEADVCLVVIGLPRLKTIIKKSKKFDSRVGIIRRFKHLTEKEVLDQLLGNLIFPHWQYNPRDEEDRKMGVYIWRAVKPSLRELRNLLLLASKLAETRGETQLIDIDIIKEAIRLKGDDDDESSVGDNDGGDDDNDSGDENGAITESEYGELGELEQNSMKRQKIKRGRKKPRA